MYYPNYLEFYQKALIPIGANDQKSLLMKGIPVDSDSSHWLIALDGNPVKKKRRAYIYTWRVAIFQVNSEGYCLLKQPYYVSESYHDFEEAYEEAKELERAIHCDHFVSVPQLQN